MQEIVTVIVKSLTAASFYLARNRIIILLGERGSFRSSEQKTSPSEDIGQWGCQLKPHLYD